MINTEFERNIFVPSAQEVEKELGWIKNQITEIGEERLQSLIQAAVEVRGNAYTPHSDYKVGAAILCQSGEIYASCNAEVVTYSETDHAERGAITKAISHGEVTKGGRDFIEAVAVSHTGESGPCGGCRQRIAQHCDNTLIIDVDADGGIQAVTSLKILFPYAFTPSHLE